MNRNGDQSDLDVLKLEVLKSIQSEVAEQRREIRELRDSVLRIETHGYAEQLKNLREENQMLRERLIVIETKGKMFTAGIAAAVSLVITIIASLIKHYPG